MVGNSRAPACPAGAGHADVVQKPRSELGKAVPAYRTLLLSKAALWWVNAFGSPIPAWGWGAPQSNGWWRQHCAGAGLTVSNWAHPGAWFSSYNYSASFLPIGCSRTGLTPCFHVCLFFYESLRSITGSLLPFFFFLTQTFFFFHYC